MHRTLAVFGPLLLLFAAGCGQRDPLPPVPVDCSVLDKYEFQNISNFTPTESGWFRYADPTPGGAPDIDGGTGEGSSNVPVEDLPPPGRCGDTRVLKLEMYGKNFWGAGFGDWIHNRTPADGTIPVEYEGISFWARSPIDVEKQFLFNVDDSRTIILPPEEPAVAAPDDAGAPDAGAPPACGLLQPATPRDQDLDGDGCVGPGDIARDTDCRLPPAEDVAGDVACYNGGVNAPASGGVRVPVANECGNAFHTRITTTETWQLFLIPWDDLVQWPCPNRLEGGIKRDDIKKFEIKFVQGTHYELWLDNIAFYRSLGN